MLTGDRMLANVVSAQRMVRWRRLMSRHLSDVPWEDLRVGMKVRSEATGHRGVITKLYLRGFDPVIGLTFEIGGYNEIFHWWGDKVYLDE